jgi:hypothetical protein
MATPNTRATFKEYCLRSLGKDVIGVNVSDDQIDDRIDEALKFYSDYHFDATEKIYLKHQVTQDDVDNGYITVPENVIGVINIFPVGSTLSTSSMFNIKYQFMMNFIQDITTAQIAPYYVAMQYIQLLEEVFIGKQPIRYSRHANRLYIDVDWDKIPPDSWIVAECYEIIDPTEFTDVWKDRWLLKYATALIKRQWGNNLKKFTGMQLPGGVQFNGQQIYDEATEEIMRMEDEMIHSYSLPNAMLIG